MPQHILVTEYCPEWEQAFQKEAESIKSILKDNCIAIYHIGSTAVKGLRAKPVIDLMPVVRDLAEADAAADEFEKIDYEYLGEFGIPGRRYMRKGGDERTHQAHIFERSNWAEIERHLAVRDYLRTHQAAARRYGELKAALAERFPYDIQGYCDGKAPFMKVLEQTALAWRREQGKGDL